MLSEEQKRFIEKRVKDLRSMKRVKAFYKRESLVTKYAHQYANKIYKDEPISTDAENDTSIKK